MERDRRPARPPWGGAPGAAARLAFEPDAGIWEYRGRSRVHTHSAAMCWAGCSRLGAIALHLGLDESAAHWTNTANAMQTRLIEQAWNEKRGAFTAAIGIEDLDASVLLLPEIGLLETHDPRFVRTVEAIERELLRDKHVMRCATSTLCVMRVRMTSASRKRLFSSAGSG